MAAGDSSGGDFEVGTWKLILFFLLILVLDTTWEFIDERVTHGIRRRKKKGLMHAWEQIKFEIMALGLVSLLLVVFEKYLLKICVDKKKDGDDSYDSEDKYDSSRRLLAPAMADTCADGKEPLWSSALIHKVHILIFLIAVSHVVYALMSLGISMLSMRRFHAFEKIAQEGDLLGLPTDQLQRDGESRIMFGIRQAVRQFTHPIDKATYIALRRLFIEAVQVDPSFDFSSFVSDYLAEEFSHVVRLEFLMWVIAIVWIAFPSEAYSGIWLTALFCSLSVIAGAKLHVIAMHLARQAYSLYYLPEDDCGDGGNSTTSEPRGSSNDLPDTSEWPGAQSKSNPVLRVTNVEMNDNTQHTPQPSLKMGSAGLSSLSKDDVKSPGSGGMRTSASDDNTDTNTPGTHSQRASPRKPHVTWQSSNDVLKDVPDAPEAPSEGVAPSRHVFSAPTDGPEAVATSASDMLAAVIPEESKESSPLSNGAGKAAPKPEAVAEGATDDAEGDSIGLPLPHSIPEYSDHSGMQSAGTKQDSKPESAVPTLEIEKKAAKNSARNSRDRKVGIKSNWGSPQRKSSTSPTRLVKTPGAPNATRAVTQTPRSPQGASKLSRASSGGYSSDDSEGGCATCMRCGRGEKFKRKSSRRVKKWEQQQEYKALFWFKRPRLMLRIFQYAYFENALSLAVLVFAFWQNEPSMIGGGIGATDPDQVMQAAKQYRVRPDIVHELEDPGDDEDDLYQETDYLPEDFHRLNHQSPLYSTSATANTPQRTPTHPLTPLTGQGSGGAMGDGIGGTQISPEGPVQVFNGTRNIAATAMSSPELDAISGVPQPAAYGALITRSNSNPDLQQQSGAAGPAPITRPRPSLARRSAAPALMNGPSATEAHPGITVGASNGPAAAPPRRRTNLARSSCPVVSDYSGGQKSNAGLGAARSGLFPNLRTALKQETRLATPRPNLQRSSATSVALDSRSPVGSRITSGQLPGQHHDPEEAPAVLETLMQSMVQYRRRLDQQGAPGTLHSARSYGSVQGGGVRPRSALSRHSDVSAVLARAASTGGTSGGVGDTGAAEESGATPGDAHSGGRRTGPRVFTRVLNQGGTTGGFIRKSTSAEQLSTGGPAAEAPE